MGKIVYLALPISGRSYDEVVSDIKASRIVLESAGYTVFHPMTGKAYLRTETQFKASGYHNPPSTNHAIYERDMFMVSGCDIFLVDFTNATSVSIGCMMELAWASMSRKHTIAIIPEGNIHNHAFVLEAADIVFTNKAEALSYLEKFYDGTI